ncbi:MAG: hypothetical protein SGI88_22160 [Candidatus Hydrogenedentes bacterium]|nr:hypothetical protein [Candidatus Hydrogenedentota bacterium]
MPDSEPSSHSPQSKTTRATQPDAFVILTVSLQKFNLGQIVITTNADNVLTPEDVKTALLRHRQCDWGDVCAEDRKVNECGVLEQGMILSTYHSTKAIKFWVITDPGHDITTVLLPEDY